MEITHTRCNGTEWVCEAHPDKPQDHDGCMAPGMPCSCNPDPLLITAMRNALPALLDIIEAADAREQAIRLALRCEEMNGPDEPHCRISAEHRALLEDDVYRQARARLEGFT